jgi:chemotaxis protein CheZ
MTEQAAQRVLNATDAASPLQEAIEHDTALFLAELKRTQGALSLDLVARLTAHLEKSQESARQTRAHLLDIMMAQDFQDLTGQVIKKVTELGHSLESQLVQLLIDYAPTDQRKDTGLLNGPQINPQGSVDVVADQGQVDDLLASLGF